MGDNGASFETYPYQTSGCWQEDQGMNAPHPAGSPIDQRRYRRWLAEFTGYRHQITEERIDRWFRQFKRAHKDLAARVLDAVDFIGTEQMFTAYRSLLASIDGWSINPAQRRGKWRFVAFSASAGESGDEMLHKFRVANNLASNRYNDLFIHKSEILRAQLNSNDTVVFVDDFSGTGEQICTTYKEQLQELLPQEPRTYLFLIAANHSAVKRVSAETEICCIPHIVLRDAENIFSEKCRHFSESDKAKLLKYCIKADRRNPKGHADCGFVLVFSHSCPNNSIPILHKCNDSWEGLFRRYDNFN
jgi:hypothetical protein